MNSSGDASGDAFSRDPATNRAIADFVVNIAWRPATTLPEESTSKGYRIRRGGLEWRRMQVLQAGERKLVLLELDTETVENILKQAGFQHRISDSARSMSMELLATDRQAPLLLFDASDPGNLGWFSRCQFYVDGTSGMVLQTPIALSNLKDSQGRPLPHSVHLQIAKELPAAFRLPGKQPVNEQMVYAVLYNFLNALLNTGVGLCGRAVIQPLAGRIDPKRQ